jgi:ComF family protein
LACVYEGAARDAVHLLKYHGKRRVAPAMAEVMARAFQRAPGFRAVDTLVPVALHASRRRKRGYNQSEWLAAEMGRLLNLPAQTWLARTRDTPSQVGLSAGERAANMRGAFTAAPEARGRNILLVDDVTTTGATARDAARALHAEGAASVCLLTFARDV